LRQYRSQFREENKDHVWNKYDDKKFLSSFGAYTIDKETGEEGLTLAGLLMFGTGLAVRERLSNFRMDYVDMSHLVGDERYHDRLTYDGRWENNVYQFMNRVIPKFTIDLPRPFRMEGIKRVDDTPQLKAVREAFTNAIIHADVFLPGGVLRIDKYDDRLVLRNPGTLRLPIEKIYEGGTSRARNPRIQNMLRMIGYGENLGSGFPMIVSAWKDAGWGEPVLKNQIELDEVELSLPVQKPMEISKNNSNENKRELSDVLKNVLKNVQKENLEKLTERQVDILEFIVQMPTITFKEMSKRLKVSVKTIQRDFTAMGLLGINIVRKDGKTYGEWVIKL
jgi:predicted HTH transcriptional regulator